MDLSQYNFYCPHCDAPLSVSGVIELITRRKNGDKGIIKLATKVGNYNYEHEPPTEFEAGEIVDFICPKCAKNLHTNQYKNFALLNMHVEQGISFEVIFSRTAGERKTYVITEDGVETYKG